MSKSNCFFVNYIINIPILIIAHALYDICIYIYSRTDN